jgi:hypothetical protein
MLDIDGDGIVDAFDLSEAQEIVENLCDFHVEIKKLVAYYVDLHIESRGKLKEGDKINVHKYKELLDGTHEYNLAR